mmetsp:Transcript_26132/g.73096  ORF Transcript_26132/g.73096 Transcript_26132/m.73096 type:complete len:342 (-) Transcript_26132:977-2002(-)
MGNAPYLPCSLKRRMRLSTGSSFLSRSSIIAWCCSFASPRRCHKSEVDFTKQSAKSAERSTSATAFFTSFWLVSTSTDFPVAARRKFRTTACVRFAEGSFVVPLEAPLARVPERRRPGRVFVDTIESCDKERRISSLHVVDELMAPRPVEVAVWWSFGNVGTEDDRAKAVVSCECGGGQYASSSSGSVWKKIPGHADGTSPAIAGCRGGGSAAELLGHGVSRYLASGATTSPKGLRSTPLSDNHRRRLPPPSCCHCLRRVASPKTFIIFLTPGPLEPVERSAAKPSKHTRVLGLCSFSGAFRWPSVADNQSSTSSNSVIPEDPAHGGRRIFCRFSRAISRL